MSLALLLAALASPAPPAETPRAFVERIYAGYRDPDYSPLARPERVFAPPLVEAIREDARLSSGEVGYMDADPLCQCQDPGGLSATIRDLRRTGPGRATARLILAFGPADRRELSLRLVRTGAGWRIADLAAAGTPSLLGEIRRFNRRRR